MGCRLPGTKQRGSIALVMIALTGLIAIILVAFFAAIGSRTKEGQLASATQNLQATKQSVLDFARQNKRLPNVAEFNVLTQGIESSLGRRPVYLVDQRFNTAMTNPCAAPNPAGIQLQRCGNDPGCAAPTVESDIVFALIDGGDAVLDRADPVYQSSRKSVSEAVSPVETIRQYATGTLAPKYGTTDLPLRYDDMVEHVSRSDFLEAAGCGLKSQGDVLESGGQLRILTTSLPPATRKSAYSHVIVAFGKDDATYAFSATGLPAAPFEWELIPSGKTAVLKPKTALVESAPGTYPLTVTVTATKGAYVRSTMQALTLVIIDCAANWIDSGAPTLSACSAGYAGTGVVQQIQFDTCHDINRTVVASDCTCVDAWTPTGQTRSGTCPAGQTGTTTEAEEFNACSVPSNVWRIDSSSCTLSPGATPICQCERRGESSNAITLDPGVAGCTDTCCATAYSQAVPPPCSGNKCRFSALCPLP